jgi:MtaA/CmuA family methyltransferase
MNSYERYINTIKGRATDFLPRLPILMQYAAEHIGSNYAAFASDYQTMVAANIQCVTDFGIDQLNTMSDPYRETQGYGADIIYPENNVPKCRKHPLEDKKYLGSLLRPNPLKSERMLDRVNAVRSYHAQFAGEYSIMGWVEGPAAEAGDLRTVSNFFIDLLDDPVFCGELMDLCVDVAIDFAKVQIEAGADTIGIGDAVASQISPMVYEKLVLPREVRLINAIREMGAYVRLHICGDITHILPGIATLDINILDIDHMVDMKTTRNIMADHVVLSGNIDPVEGILKGTPETIKTHMRQIYQEIGNPYMVNAGCEIPHGTPVENLKALCSPIRYQK